VIKPVDMIALGDCNWDLKQKGDRDWSGFFFANDFVQQT